ncbi:hypothetical protein PRUB_a3420 [Pseudoalteromonas rubra]|uniref:Uncharacterized protein n=1 Tax=Pseudoalteromonas rubra TaxID=43658 RepID=A0A8T0C4J8_9GAMM|nr:hypothetical protein [Pseudoalteromonas rubra]KAF7783603.1 hypothetical protein PRUB_a3420 [Pseudoalteromonas rubra]
MDLLDEETISFLTHEEKLEYYKAQSEVSKFAPKLSFDEGSKSEKEMLREAKAYEKMVRKKLAPFLKIALDRKNNSLKPTVASKLKAKLKIYLTALSAIIAFLFIKNVFF